MFPENSGKSFQIRIGPSNYEVGNSNNIFQQYSSSDELCLEVAKLKTLRLKTAKCSQYSVAQKFIIRSVDYIESKQYPNKCLSVNPRNVRDVKFTACPNSNNAQALHYRWVLASDETIRPLKNAINALALYNRKEMIEGMVIHNAPTTNANKAQHFHFELNGIFDVYNHQSSETTTSSESSLIFSSHGYYNLFTSQTVDVKIQMWGAGGGGCNSLSTRGSAGGYTEAIVTLVKDSSYTLIVGQGGEGGGYGIVSEKLYYSIMDLVLPIF